MSTPAPDISVIIATHGRPRLMAECVAALSRQSLAPHRYEVIIADDCTPVPLTREGLRLHEYPHLQVTLTRTAHQSGPSGARNRAVELARGTLLAVTDDDCLPDAHWLEALWQAHLAHPQALLGGKLYNVATDLVAAEASQVISDMVYAWYNRDPENCRFFSMNNSAVGREAFLEMGMFDEDFRGASEDRDFCERWYAAGRPMRFVADAVIGHNHRLTVKKFLAQHVYYGRGAAVYHAKRGGQTGGSMRKEMPFHRALPGLAVRRLRREPVVRRVQLAGLLGLWQVANAWGYFHERYVRNSTRG